MRARICITCGEDAPHDTRVFIDDHEVVGLSAIGLKLDAVSFPKVLLEFEPEHLKFDGMADLGRKIPEWKDLNAFAYEATVGKVTIRIEAPSEEELATACKRAGFDWDAEPTEAA